MRHDAPATPTQPIVPMDRGFWTGGQYSLCRAIAGLGFAASALALVLSGPGSGARLPNLVLTPIGIAAGAAALAWAAGLADRLAAVVLLLAGAALVVAGAAPFGRAVILCGAILIAHLLIPSAPYGSLDARGRTDPGGGWRMPRIVWIGLWVALAAAYAGGSAARLVRPEWFAGAAPPPGILRAAAWTAFAAGIAFAPAVLVPRLRAAAWTILAGIQVIRLALLPTSGDAGALLAAHLFTFDPGWVRGAAARGVAARGAAAPETLFYDGTCGLCHRAVRFVIAEDPGGPLFRFAPLQGGLFRATLSEKERTGLPDSLVLLAADGRILTRSRSVRHLLARLGGWWTVLAAIAAVVPVPLGDAAYDLVARVRHRLFARPVEACPILPARLRTRFVID